MELNKTNKRKGNKMNIEKHAVDGFTISDIIQNKLGHELYIKRRYIGYSISVAKRKFKSFCVEIRKKENKQVNNCLINY